MADKPKRGRFFCATCRRETNHAIEAAIEDREDAEHCWLISEWAIIRCAGCDEHSFAYRTWFSEDMDHEGNIPPTVVLYPKRDENTLQTRSYTSVPQKLRRIYREVIECFNSDCFTMCAAGLRALVEGICADKRIPGVPVPFMRNDGTSGTKMKKDLEGKIDGLVAQNLLTKAHATLLHKHRFLGNAAVHELHMPSADSLKAAIQIIEHTLENLYELKSIGRQVRKRG